MNTTSKEGSLFELDGVPKLSQAFPLALQHVVAMIVGCVTPAIIISGAAGLETADRVLLIQASLVVSALATLLQLFPIGKKTGFHLGAGLPVIIGVSFAYVPSMQAIADQGGIPAILGAQIVGGVCAILVGLTIKKIRKFFPPLIAGTVVFTIGLSLYPTAINYMAGRYLYSGSCYWFKSFCKRIFKTGIYPDWYDHRIYLFQLLWYGKFLQRSSGWCVPASSGPAFRHYF